MGTANGSRGMAVTITYWTTTIIFCLGMGAGGFFDITVNEQVREGLGKLGYPAYLGYILGFWKLAGVAALLAPGTPRVKEWAYAGFVFNLTGASASHAFVGDPLAMVIVPLIGVALGGVSYCTRPPERSL